MVREASAEEQKPRFSIKTLYDGPKRPQKEHSFTFSWDDLHKSNICTRLNLNKHLCLLFAAVQGFTQRVERKVSILFLKVKKTFSLLFLTYKAIRYLEYLQRYVTQVLVDDMPYQLVLLRLGLGLTLTFTLVEIWQLNHCLICEKMKKSIDNRKGKKNFLFATNISLLLLKQTNHYELSFVCSFLSFFTI